MSLFPLRRSILIASFLLAGGSGAQTVVLDWNHRWNYLHPDEGTLPPGSGATTLHPDGTTPWFAVAQEFQVSYQGPSFSSDGPGPLGYGVMDYTVDAADPEFLAFGTNLITPPAGDRRTAYFRTTFTIPDDGSFYVNPEIRYLLDDGGFVYLDGELILQVNISGADDYFATAGAAGDTEFGLRTAELALSVGAATGANPSANPPLDANATVVRKIERLTPGEHTLAVSLHNASVTSSDLALAVQLTAEVTDCLITGSADATTRHFEGTPSNRFDDTVSTEVTVVPEGATGNAWRITGPEESTVVGQSGAYNTPVLLDDLPLSAFQDGHLTLELADVSRPDCRTTVALVLPRLIGSIAWADLPLTTVGDLDPGGWIFDEDRPAMTLNEPADPDRLYPIASEVIDLTGRPDVELAGTLTIVDTSSGNEAEDQFRAELILDGDNANPVSLIDRHDVIDRDGVLTGGELAPGPGTFVRPLSHIIPAGTTTAQVIIRGSNNSDSESFIVSDLTIRDADPALRAYSRSIFYDNRGTIDPGDDVFTAEVVITPANLGASTGWRSNASPTSGSYSAANPVLFGPFRPFEAPVSLTLEDRANPNRTAQVTLSLPDAVLSVSAPENVTRVENGPGFDDDTLTFEVDISGERGGPGWKINSAAVSPVSGEFGRVQFSVPAPLAAGALTVELVDVSYRNVTTTLTVDVPGRFLIGQSDLSGTLEDVVTSATLPSSSLWQNDRANRTLSFSAPGAGPAEVISETIDLSGQGPVYFSALLRASETSNGSNFETGDRFRAELFHRTDEGWMVTNLVAPWDLGDGTSAVTGGVNGPPDGFLNGYTGAVGTDLQTNAVYATDVEDYDANRGRDEFNRDGLAAGAIFTASFPLRAEIPSEAEEAYLVVTAEGAGGNEEFVLSEVLFSIRSVEADRDGDGIPDSYEISNGLDPDDASDRDLDPDRDGQSNFAEYLAGTAANDWRSHLRITGYRRDGDLVTATWSSVPGKSYRIQFSTDFVTWTDLGVSFEAAGAPAGETSSGALDLAEIGLPDTAGFRVLVSP